MNVELIYVSLLPLYRLCETLLGNSRCEFHAVNLGHRDGCEIVRLYTSGKKQLLVKSLLDKNLVVPTKTFIMAPQHLPRSVSMTPDDECLSFCLPPINIAYKGQVTLPVKFYTSSSLHLKKSTPVTVINIQNGVKYFTVFNKSKEMEYSRVKLKLHLERVF